MEQITKTTRTTTCLLFFFISSYLFLSSLDRTTYSSALSLFAAFLLAFLIIFAVRTTTVTWITVMVLLAFLAGKRRRVLAKEGVKITSDVAMLLAQVVVKERSLVAFACATFVSLIGMAWLRV